MTDLAEQAKAKRHALLGDYGGEYAVVSSHALDYALAVRDDGDIVKLKTLIPSLDYYLGGFELGTMTFITGHPKGGKTLLCQTITEAYVRQEHQVLWIPFEVTGRRFFRGFGDVLPKFFIPEKLKRYDLEWIEDRIVEAKMKFQIQAVFIDHLHFLFDMIGGGNTSLLIGVIMRRLVGMAQDHNVALFLIAHQTKIKRDKNHEVLETERGDVRDSGMIEAESDYGLAVWRGEKDGPDSRTSRVKILYDRSGGVFGRTIEMHKGETYLHETEKHRETAPAIGG